jgi:serine/threonine protein phosphatase 1
MERARANDLTEGRRLYIVGDIHGRLDLLDEMLARIRSDLARRPHDRPQLIFLGDYVDRGPDSRGVIETLVGLRASELPASFLLGNHDNYLQAYLRDDNWEERGDNWLSATMGGAATLASYGIAGPAAPDAMHDAFAAGFPPAHLAFLDACELSIRIGGYLFVHAGIRPGVAIEAQDPGDLIWIREPFLNSRQDFSVKVVHGHTIVPQVEHHPNRLAVDTGAVRSGVLSCLALEGAAVALLEPGGPRPWPEGSGTGVGRIGAKLRGLLSGR